VDESTSLVEVADSILYISSLLADGPRPIDQVIDYFGESRRGAGRSEDTGTGRPRDSRPR
jgi:hypothetical protein